METKNLIKIEENLDFVLSTGLDSLGKVFFRDGRVFRGIFADKIERFQKLFQSGLLVDLADKGFIPRTEISDYFNDEFPLIVEHEYIEGIEACFWSFSMLRDAGLHLLEVNETAKKYGYQLFDSHPWNVLIHKNKPVFIDIGSFVPIGEKSWFEGEYVRTIFYPLMIWSLGDSFWAQKFLYEPTSFYKRTMPMILPEDTLAIKVYIDKFAEGKSEHLKTVLRKIIEEKDLKAQYMIELFPEYLISTDWHEYQNWLFENLETNEPHIQLPRFLRIVELVRKYSCDAKSIVDLAGNSGGLTHLLAKDNDYKKVLCADYDEMAVENGYKKLREIGSEVAIFLANFMLPCKSSVYNLAKADVVIASAITHHLLLTQNFSIDFIFSQIAKYSNKYVYIEFMPLGLWSLYYPEDIPEIPDWYTQSWFEENFKKHFEFIYKEQLERNRIMFVGRVK